MHSSKKIMNSIKTILLFLLVLFATLYWDFFYVYEPVSIFNGSTEASLQGFIISNFSLKAIYYLVKFIFVTAILSAGIVLTAKKNESQSSFDILLLIVVMAEFTFLSRDLYKIVFLSFFRETYSFTDYSNFYPFSLFVFLSKENTDEFAYLYQMINLFEFTYITLLIFGLSRLLDFGLRRAAIVVISTYGTVLVGWIIVKISFF